MRRKASSKTDRSPAVTRTPWHVKSVRVLPHYRLHVRFADGTEGEVDVSDLILSKRPGVFERLRDRKEFAKARVRYGAVTWPGELDLAPDAMYDEIKAGGA